MEISPARRELEEYGSVVYEYPFGKSRARNVLQNFYPSPAITDIKVLMLIDEYLQHHEYDEWIVLSSLGITFGLWRPAQCS